MDMSATGEALVVARVGVGGAGASDGHASGR